MAESAVARRRRQGQALATLKRVFVGALVVVAVGAIAFGAVRLAMDPAFQLGSVAVVGFDRESEEAVRSAAALPIGSNVWFMDTAGAADRVEALPWVRSGHVDRQWPNLVTISITERVPAARVMLPEASGKRYAVVDDGLRVLAVEVDDERDAALPVLFVQPLPSGIDAPGSDVSSAQLAQALDASKRLAKLGVRITEIESKPATGIGFTTASHLRVLFGSTADFERKVELLGAIVKRIAHPEEVAYVDLRSAAAPTVLYR
ncbi:MAG TPA: FtsQ-type POTRA domain-containing protein [Candidatus Tumulicola sp.]|nr:FtsQ-type POTRA domain-containing protein [Candidatus Tumulicola sp.]